MADPQRDAGFVGQSLTFDLEQAHARAVRAAAIGGDDDARGFGISGTADFIPPPTDCLNREGRGVTVMPTLTQPASAAMS
jgi:hypothetical protein